MSNRGSNTVSASLKILNDTTFSFFLPTHSFNYNQGYCFMYTLLSLPPDYYVDSLIISFDTQNDFSQKSILTTLWFAYSCEGDNFMKSVIENTKYNESIRDYTGRLLKMNSNKRSTTKMAKEYYGKINLDEMWKSALKRFSDEAITELDFVCKARRRRNKCR